MRAAFRVDASETIGSGHVMRCLTLARALRHRNVSSLFLSCLLPPQVHERVTAEGFDVRLLPLSVPESADIRLWRRTTLLREDAAACGRVLREGVDILSVDQYGLDAQWEQEMRRHARVLLAIDDLADRTHACDVVLDANLVHRMKRRYDGLVPKHCRRLLGPAYALLRDEFRAGPSGRLADATGRHVLISFGGTDPDALTERALDELWDADVTADVVLGMPIPSRRAALERRCRESAGRFRLHVRTDRMAELMAAADAVLGAGGTSHWERCRMGLPAIVVTVASNQVETTRILAEKGACFWLGDSSALEPGAFRRALDRFLNNPDAVAAMRKAAQTMGPDGKGADRVADVLVGLAGGGCKREYERAEDAKSLAP